MYCPRPPTPRNSERTTMSVLIVQIFVVGPEIVASSVAAVTLIMVRTGAGAGRAKDFRTLSYRQGRVRSTRGLQSTRR